MIADRSGINICRATNFDFRKYANKLFFEVQILPVRHVKITKENIIGYLSDLHIQNGNYTFSKAEK